VKGSQSEEKRLHDKSSSEQLLKIYADLDEQLQPELEKHPISCREGCTHCCLLMVLVGVQESLLIADKVMSSPAWKHYLRELRKAAKVMGLVGETQETYFARRRPCVFLNKRGLCDVYDVRPSACRYHFVVSPPDHCSPEHNNHPVMELNTSICETIVWKFESDCEDSEFMFAPLPLMVLHTCLLVAMQMGGDEKIKEVHKHLKGLIDPLTWLKSVDHEEMGQNTDSVREAYKAALDAVGITGGEDGEHKVQE
jgi:Fe-S-cluster containining protein